MTTAPAQQADRSWLSRLAAVVLRRRRVVGAAWAVVFVGAAMMMAPTFALMEPTVSAVKGKEAFEVNSRLLKTYGNGGISNPIVPTITLPRGTTVDSPGVKEKIGAAFQRIQREVPLVRVADYASTGDRGFVSKDGRTTFGVVFSPPPSDMHEPPAATDAVRRVIAGQRIAGASFVVTGTEVGKENPDRKSLSASVEGMVGGIGALLILLLAFRSAIALIPIMTAVVSIATSVALMWPIAKLTTTPSIVTYVLVLIGLGISVDYALLIVTRWREEREAGFNPRVAAGRAVTTAGRAVVVSGLTVAVGLLALVAIPVSFLRSIGYAGVLIPLVAIAVSLTLVPAVLATAGPGLERVRLPGRRRAATGERWARWAQVVVRRPAIAAIAATAVLAALIIPATSLNVRSPKAESLAAAGAPRVGLSQLEKSGIGAGALTPIEVVAPSGEADATAARIRQIDGVRTVVAPVGPQWRRGGTAAVTVIPSADVNSKFGRELVKRVRTAAHEVPGAQVGGEAAQAVDFTSAVYGSFPIMLALIFIVTLVGLARAFRSVVLPIKAMLLNIVTVSAALGAVVLIWQDGNGSKALWDVAATGSITEFVPLMTFAFLFGISMDYEVFILSRMREEYDRSGSTSQAVVEGMRRTGRLVTLAGLILAFAFISLGTSNDTNINMFASGLAVGIIVDATIVRAVLVPALVALMGRWNWWMPRWASRRRAPRPAEVAAS